MSSAGPIRALVQSLLFAAGVADPINIEAIHDAPREVVRRAGEAPVVVAEAPSTAELIGATVSDLASLVRAELQLAKAELQETAADLKRVVVLGAVCAVFSVGALLLLTHALALSLTFVLPEWAAYLAAGLLLAGLAAAFALRLQRNLKRVEPLPDRALETSKENLKWLKEQIS